MAWSLAAVLVATIGGCVPAPAGSSGVVVASPRQVSFPAVVDASGFDHGEMAGYHLVVWSNGGAANEALFRARVSDLEVLDALEALGADPGDALGLGVWDHRHDPHSEEPDQAIAGPRLRLEVRLPGSDRGLRLDELLEDPGGRGFDMRLGGHRANVPAWKSGCVVCLYSCPGSKVGNAAYTVRDFVAGATRFRPRPGVLPPDGTEVEILFTIKE